MLLVLHFIKLNKVKRLFCKIVIHCFVLITLKNAEMFYTEIDDVIINSVIPQILQHALFNFPHHNRLLFTLSIAVFHSTLHLFI